MNKPKGYHIFEEQGEFYLYDFQGSIIVQISEELYEILRQFELYGREDTFGIISELRANGALQDFDVSKLESLERNATAYLTFAPTYECNFRCKYCFGDAGAKYQGQIREFNKRSLCEMLDFFFYKAFPEANNYRIDFVSGGEPLLGFNRIKDTILYIEQFHTATNKQVSVWLCTNGSLLTDDIAEFLSTHNVSIGVSLDGRKERNDLYRFDKGGNGTYELVLRGIELIKENSRVTNKFKNIWGLCTATNENCDFIDTLVHMKELGFRHVQIRLIRSKEKYNVELFISQYRKLAKFLLEMYKSGDTSYLKMILNDNDQFGKVLKRILLDEFLIRRCNAGLNKITICPDGTIFPCDSMVGIQQFSMGRIGEHLDPLSSWKNRTVDEIPECQSCDIKYLCGGDCYYNAFMKTGSAIQPDHEFCTLQRKLINIAISLRVKMKEYNQNQYDSFVTEVKRGNDYSLIFG